MVDIGLRRLTKLTWGVVLIIWALNCQVSKSVWESSNAEIATKQHTYTSEITKSELNEFMKLWPQFKDLGLAEDLVVSYKVEKPSKFVDWKSKVWFVYNRWDVDRFFYVQERANALLQTLKVRRDARLIMDMLEDRNEQIARQMYAVQEKRSLAGEDSKGELMLVAENEDALKKLFN